MDKSTFDDSLNIDCSIPESHEGETQEESESSSKVCHERSKGEHVDAGVDLGIAGDGLVSYDVSSVIACPGGFHWVSNKPG